MSLFDLFSTGNKKSTTTNRVVGIDVGSSSIKVVELQDRNDVVTLTTYGEIQLGPYLDNNVVGQAVTLPPEVERQALVDVLRESAVKAREAVLAIPLSASFVTTMTIPATAKEDITPRVRVEARKYIPVPIAEVVLDWAEVETKNVVNETSRDVLLAAIQHESLGRFNVLLKTVEIQNPLTEIECFSAIRSLYTNSEIDSAVIDVGATSTKLYLMRTGLLQRMYRVRAGGAYCTEQISKELSLSFEEAETLKRSITRDHSKFSLVQKIHQNHFDRVLKEFKQVIEEYEARTGAVVSSMYLAGGGSHFPGLDSFFSNNLSRKIVKARPFNKVAYPAFMEDTMNEIGPEFSVALGAALRSFE
jgi:type IV pilus assembly protein PilM